MFLVHQTQVTGEIRKRLDPSSVPASAASDYPVAWTGDLQSNTDQTSIGCWDLNLFDGAPVAVLKSPSPVPDVELLLVGDNVHDVAGDVALLLDPWAAVPSGFHGTIRGALLQPQTNMERMYKSGRLLSDDGSSMYGMLLLAQSACGAGTTASCPASITEALRILVVGAQKQASGACETITAVNGTTQARTSTDIFVAQETAIASNSTSYVRAVSTQSQALFKCSRQGQDTFIGITVGARPDSSLLSMAKWPSDVTYDPKALRGASQVLSIRPYGHIYGTCQSDSGAFAALTSDMFSDKFGGVLVPTPKLTPQSAADLFTTMRAALNTGNFADGALDTAILQNVFVQNAANKVSTYQSLFSRTDTYLLPFLEWYLGTLSEDTMYELHISPTGAISLTLSLGAETNQCPKELTAYANNATKNLGAAIMAQRSSTTGLVVPQSIAGATCQVHAIMTATVTLLRNGESYVPSTKDKQMVLQGSGKLDVTFPPPSNETLKNLIQKVEVLLDLSSNRGHCIGTATAPNMQPGSYSTVVLDADSKPVFDKAVNGGSVAQKFKVVADEIADQNYTQTRIDSINLEPGIFCVQTNGNQLSWKDALSAAADALSTATTTFAVVRSVAQYFSSLSCTSHGGTAIVIPNILPTASGGFQGMVQIHLTQQVGLPDNHAQWDNCIDTDRLNVPLLTSTAVSLTVVPNTNTAKMDSFLLSATARLTSWALPMLYMMKQAVVDSNPVADAGLNQDSVLMARIAVPNSLELSMTFPARSEFESKFNVSVVSSKTEQDFVAPPEPTQYNADSKLPSVTISFPSAVGQYNAHPARVLNTLQHGVLQLLPNVLSGSLNFAIPPLTDPLSKMNSYGDLSTTMQDVMMFDRYPENQMVPSGQLCPGKISELPIQYTMRVNNRDQTCWVDSLNTVSTLEEISQKLNASFAACGFNLVETVVASREKQHEKENICGTLALKPRVIGAVWRLSLNITDLKWVSKWTNYRRPAFGTWSDMQQLVAATFSSTTSPTAPAAVDVDIANVPNIVPDYLRSVYPPTLPSVTVALRITHQDPLNQVSMNSTYNSPDEAVSAVVEDFEAQGQMSSSLSMRFGAIFDGGIMSNLTMFTNFDGDQADFSTTKVPAVNNSFKIIVVCQLRTSDNKVQQLVLDETIKLNSGELLSSELLDLPLRIQNERLKALLSTSELPENVDIQQNAQVVLVVNPVLDVGSSTSWLVPSSLSIQQSQMPGLCFMEADGVKFMNIGCNNSATTTALISSALDMSVKADATVSGSSMTGRLGIVPLSATQPVKGKTQVSVNLTQPEIRPVTLLSAATLHAPLTLSQLGVQVGTETALLVEQVEALVDDVSKITENPSLLLNLNNWAKLKKDFDAINITRTLHNIEHKWQDAKDEVLQIYHDLEKLDPSSLCTWVEQLSKQSSEITKGTYNKGLLAEIPFGTWSLSRLWSMGLGNLVNDVSKLICKSETREMHGFIRQLNASFDVSATKSAVTSTGFYLDVNAVMHSTFSEALRFDTPKLFKHSFITLPVGLGASASVLTTATISAQVRLEADWSSGNGVTIRLAPDYTKFAVYAYMNASGSAGIRFGPLEMNFAGVDLWLSGPSGKRGEPAGFEATLSGGRMQTRIFGQASFKAALNLPTNEPCQVQVSVRDLSQPRFTVDDTRCVEGFPTALKNALLQNTLLSYFENAGHFVDNYDYAFRMLISGIFGGEVSGARAPLIGTLIQDKLTEALQKLFGPELTKQLLSGIDKMTTDLLRTRNLTKVAMDANQILLDGITEIICSMFKGYWLEKVCPEAPRAHSESHRRALMAADSSPTPYVWEMDIGQRKTIKVANFDFDLGSHGPGALGIAASGCNFDLVLEWGLKFSIVFDHVHGLSFNYSKTERILHAEGKLELGDGCKLSGQLIFLGAELAAQGFNGVRVSFNVTRPEEKFSLKYGIEARVAGTAMVGFAGRSEDNAPAKLNVFPHFSVFLGLNWTWTLEKQIRAPTFSMGNVKFCVGSFLARLLQNTLGKVHEVLQPINPIIGPNGVLTKKIEGLKYIFGKPMNLIQVAQAFCMDECVFKNAIKATEYIVQIYKVINQVTGFGVVDPDGCGMHVKVKNFTANFSLPKVEPKYVQKRAVV